MADIALVPEGDIFQRRDRVAADHAGQTAQAFAGDRVAFVRHGGTAFLPLGEKLLHLENFGALQMTELRRPAVDGTGGQRQHCHKLRMPVALHDLRGQRGGLESEFLADFFFDARIEVGAGADGAAEFAYGDTFAHLDETFAHAAEFVVHQRHFQSEGHRFGMDAVAAAHHGRKLVGPRLLGGGGPDFIDAFDQEIGGFGHLHGQRRVEHVGGGEPLVHPARGGTDGIGDVFQKGDDVVVGAFFNLEDLGNGKTRLGADLAGVLLRDLPEASHGFAGEGFDLEPDVVFALVGPEGSHLRSGISVNHRATLAEDPRRSNP